MWLSAILTSGRSSSRRARPSRKASCRLTVELLEERTLPSFLAPVSYPVPGYPVAVGDFDNDGTPDLALFNQPIGTVNILLGKSDGTFQAAGTYSVGAPSLAGSPGSTSIAVGDFNNDGKLDIVTMNAGGVNVLLGNGNGTFQPAISTPVNITNPTSLAVGDFNKDGNLDVAVAGTYGYGPYGGALGGVQVLLGNGTGGFSPASTYQIPFSGPPTSIVAGDIGANLGLVTLYGSGLGGVAGVLVGNGNGTFALPTGVDVGAAYQSMAWSGGLFVTAGNGTVEVRRNLYSAPVDYTVGSGPIYSLPIYSVAMGDFNNDGNLDIVTANYFSDTVSVLLGNANGTFQPPQNYAAGVTYPVSLAVGDFNRDGWPDVTVTNGVTLSVLLNGQNWPHLAVSAFASPTTAGVPGNFTVTVYNSNGTIDTGFTGTVTFTSSDPQAVLPANYTFTAADAGVHTFSATLYTAGTQSIAATDTTALSLAGRETGITVNPAAASTMIVAGFPSPTTAGVAGSFTVTLKNTYGNLASGYTGTVHFTSSDAKASLPANYTFTAADAGKHTFSAILKTAGTQTITATDTITTTLTGTDGGIIMTPAAASRFLITAPSTVTAGVAFSLTITVEDAYGNVVTGYAGTIHFSSTDSTATLPANYTFTAADKGVHTFTGLILRKTGKQTITITDTMDSALTDSVIVDVLAPKKN